MTRQASADLLVEIGTEELPPKALKTLMQAFADGLAAALAEQRLAFKAVTPYASPRRLAVKIADVAGGQADREVDQKGPPVRIAFDKNGKPTKAAQAFADKCGVTVDKLGREETDKGEWLVHRALETGR
ncbi:MAG: glycine--tRNA ligase subunit beta, partial [Woeseia sp.]